MKVRDELAEDRYRDAAEHEEAAIAILEGIKNAILMNGDCAFLYPGPVNCDALELINWYLKR